MTIELDTYATIGEIPAALWDDVDPQQQPFHRHAFLQATHTGKIENALQWYLVFRRGKEFIATTTLTLITVDLALFIGASRTLHFVRRFSPNFLKIPILMCGIPVSLGQKNLALRREHDAKDVIAHLALAMERLATRHDVRHLVVKELAPTDTAFTAALEQAGYFRGYSLPYMSLALVWPSFSAYLQAMRHNYRRHALASLARLGKTSPGVVAMSHAQVLATKGTVLALVPAADYPMDHFFTGYLRVMQRAVTKLETLNLDFFHALVHEVAQQIQLLVLAIDGSVRGAAMLVADGDELVFALLAKEDDRDADHTYYNLLLGIIEHAIDHGYRRVGLGQTSYWPKQRLGGLAEDRFLYYRARQPLIHVLLRALRAVLFPRLQLSETRVFKTEPHA